MWGGPGRSQQVRDFCGQIRTRHRGERIAVGILSSGEAWRRLLFRSPNSLPLLLILIAVLVANAPALLGLVTINPLLLNAFLAHVPQGHLPGMPYIDGNAGFT